jgi:hypothetical protein
MLGSGEKLARHCFNCRKKETDRIAQKKMDAAVRGKPPSHFLKFWFPLETQDCATVVWTSAPRNSPMPLAGPCLLDAMSVETREGLELPRSARKHIRRRSITQRIFLKMESSATMESDSVDIDECLPDEFDDTSIFPKTSQTHHSLTGWVEMHQEVPGRLHGTSEERGLSKL